MDKNNIIFLLNLIIATVGLMFVFHPSEGLEKKL